eukprot:1194483-Prorocentrum_minimum.AAC.5
MANRRRKGSGKGGGKGGAATLTKPTFAHVEIRAPPRPFIAAARGFGVGVSVTVGVEAADANIDKLFAELEGKDLAELIAEGTKKLASVPSGGGGGGGAAPAAGGGAAAAAKAPEPEPEEEEEVRKPNLHTLPRSLFY